VVWRYLQLFLFPVGQTVDHGLRLSQRLFSPASTLPAMLGLAALIGLLSWLAWRRNEPAFWGLGFFVLLSPTSSIVPVQDVMFEHRVYFPSLCLVIASAGLLARLPRRVLVPAVVAILIVLLGLTIARNRVWHDSKVLWTDAIQKSPDSAHPWAAMGRQLMKIDVRRARPYMDRAAALDPDNPGIQNDAGVAALQMKDGEAAAQYLRRAVAQRPNIPSYQSDLGLALILVNDDRGALEHFQKAIEVGGPNQYRLGHVGDAYYRLGQMEQAIDYYRRALQMDPCLESARKGLVRALGAQGKLAQAAAASQVPSGCRLR
jgi:tetratricopeptide (TPR) repeat protein